MIDVGHCGHNQADLDMFDFHFYAVLVGNNVPREVRRGLFVGEKSGLVAGDVEWVSDAWLKRVLEEFVVKTGTHCEACCYGEARKMFNSDFFMLCSIDEASGAKNKRRGGVTCQGTIAPADIGWMYKSRGTNFDGVDEL